MTDREQLEARATELGITIQASMKDTTIQRRIDEREQEIAVENANKSTGGTDENDASKDAVQPPKSGAYVEITGPAKGRWRIGKHFTRQTQRLELDDLTEAELSALKNDPELAVTVVPVP
jgi:hypothetical protein